MCITSSEGYLLHVEPCCGINTDWPDTGLGQGTDVVLGLIEICLVKDGSTVAFDNLFTSLPLLDELTELGIGALVTLWQNRFHGNPVVNNTKLAKKPRESYDFATDDKNWVVSWLVNKFVTCATNSITCNPVSTVQQWPKVAKKQVDVAMPKPFEGYNKQIGGVDLYNQFVFTYSVCIRSKKWWWPFFAWAVIASANAGTFFALYRSKKLVC